MPPEIVRSGGYTLGWTVGEPARSATIEDLRLMSASERARYETLPPDRGRRFSDGRALLRSLVAAEAGVSSASVVFSARCPDCGADHGGPVVTQPAAARRLRVSLSHSGEASIAVATWDRSVGVDAEAIATVGERVEAICALTDVPGGAGESTADRAVRHWTRVEAVLKADGRGLRLDPRTVRVHEEDGRAEAIVEGRAARYLLTDPQLPVPLRVAVAVEL
jgi:4'-phosphopantetheinyl transferase